ncbi:hypothetical protein BGZ65_009321, partial [Modicella reniformis]
MYNLMKNTQGLEYLNHFHGTHLFMYQMQTDKSLGALAIFAGLAGLVIFIFLIYNLYLIATGVTTNENFKWEDIGEMIYGGELFEVQEIDPAGMLIGPKRYEQRDRLHPRHPRH